MRRRWLRPLWLVPLVASLLTGCTARPADPGAGEMTGVVVSGNDACCWPSGGGTTNSPHYEVVALLPPGDFVQIWNEQHPDDDRGPITPDDWRARSSGIQVPVSVFHDDADPGDEPLFARVVVGRWRVPYDGDPVMVCVGRRGHEYRWVYADSGSRYQERVDDQEYLFMRCGLVDYPAPVGVTVTVHFGLISVEAGG